MILAFVLIILSVVILYYGAEFALEASEVIGKFLGLSPLVIGMLLVGMGTSLPEFFVSHIAGLKGKPDLALGTLIGSNIANLFLVLGICGLLVNIRLHHKSIKHQLFMHLGLVIMLYIALTQKIFGAFSGILLFSYFLVYLYLLFIDMKKSMEGNKERKKGNLNRSIYFKLLAGFGMLYVGGELLVYSGTKFSMEVGISEYVISAIFIAFGTSFPELVTALLSCVKKKDTDLIIGNIIGSNVFNCAACLGSMGLYNFELSSIFAVELSLLAIGSVILLSISLFNKSIGKITGFIFLNCYLFAVLYWTGTLTV